MANETVTGVVDADDPRIDKWDTMTARNPIDA
jgi:hypothetical protein